MGGGEGGGGCYRQAIIFRDGNSPDNIPLNWPEGVWGGGGGEGGRRDDRGGGDF